MRKVQLATNEYYHIYNRGVDKRKVFLDDLDYLRFLKSMKEFNSLEPIGSLYEKYLREKKNGNYNGSSTSIMEVELPKLVEIIAYCLNPNHYHFILRQVAEKGIEKFMQRLGTSYTKYFNQKNSRTGALFGGKFKSSHIAPNALLYLSAYVSCNSEIHGIAKAENYHWCSFPEFIGKRKEGLCETKEILGQFKSGQEYFDFAVENIKNQIQRKADEKLLLEEI
ncbi:MAG: transposase [Parcubacteria group bacterium]|jgi:REP element-mobilizing transposase RayT